VGYIFYLFLLIAIINLVNNAVKRARSHEESRRSPGRSRPAMQSRPAGSQSRLEKSRPGDAKTELPLSPAHLPEKKAESGLQPSAQKGAVPVNVARIFTEKDQLLAAFIFHEVLGPPRSLRPRRTPPFAKGGPGGI